MTTLESIETRRSIRRYEKCRVSDEQLNTLLRAATLAPSAGNSQPWQFLPLRGDAKQIPFDVFRSALAEAELQPAHRRGIENSTVIAMEQADVHIYVFSKSVEIPSSDIRSSYINLTSLLSIGASIENLLILATDMGIGSLWICDHLYAFDSLSAHFIGRGTLVSVITLGSPAEQPAPRPRKPIADVILT